MTAQSQAKSHASGETGHIATPAMHMLVPLANIIVKDRLRPIDPGHVANLRVSMRESGFTSSLLLRPVGRTKLRWLTEGVAGLEGGTFQVVYGAHRHAAATDEGFTEVPATIRVMSDDEALQLEIDENLIRKGLSPLERAEQLAKRLEVWGRRFPDRVTHEGPAAPKRGRPKNSDKMSQFLGGVAPTMGFAAETAADLGLADRTVERGLIIVRGLLPEIRASLHGTWIAKNEGVLRELAQIADPADQAGAIEQLLGGKTKSVSDARAYAAGREPVRPPPTPTDEVVAAFRKLWGGASPSARDAILHELAGKALPKGWTVVREDEA